MDERTCDTCGEYHEKRYPINKCPYIPLHTNCRCTYLPVIDLNDIKQPEKQLKGKMKDGIIQSKITKEAVEVHKVGKIDIEIYKCMTEDSVREPDYIIEANKPNTALVLKKIRIENEVFKTVLRLAISKNNPRYKNSIITFMKIGEKEWNRIVIINI